MLNIGFWELCVVLIVALVVIGPERLPEVAKKLGQVLGFAGRKWHKLKNDFNQEIYTAQDAKQPQGNSEQIAERVE